MQELARCRLCGILFWTETSGDSVCWGCIFRTDPVVKKAKTIPLEGFTVMDLLKLTHPDKHGNSELSNRVTQALLKLR